MTERAVQQDYIHDLPLLLPPHDQGALVVLLYESLDAQAEWRAALEEGVRRLHSADSRVLNVREVSLPGLGEQVVDFLTASRGQTPEKSLFVSVLGFAELPDAAFAQGATELNQQRDALRIPRCWLALWMTAGRMEELARLAPDLLSCVTVFRPSFDQATLRDELVDPMVRHFETKHGVSSDQFLDDWQKGLAEQKYPDDWRPWYLYLQARRGTGSP